MPPLDTGLLGPASSAVMVVHGRTGERVGELGGGHS